jgi:muconate cycloisomerase
MKLTEATLYALRIPFVERFRHSATERRWCDSVVVRVQDDAGVEGFGEGAPRPYVTGETVESTLDHLANRLWPAIAGRELPTIESLADVDRWIPDAPLPGAVAAGASRAAVELAVLDVALRRSGQAIARLLPPRRTQVRYSGVITAGSLETAVQHARQARMVGLRDVKLKVGFDDDVERIARIRDVLGADVTLRLDANGAWTFARAVTVLEAVAPLGIAAIEQPLPRGPVAPLVALREATSVPVMVDESIVTLADANELLSEHAIDFVNVRVSKCGGLARSVAIATRALASGVGVQVGCQVGETAILSAAGRHLAAALPAVAFVEGSFGTLLLTADVVVDSVRFGHGGHAPVLIGPGLGVQVMEPRLRRFAHTVVELDRRRGEVRACARS